MSTVVVIGGGVIGCAVADRLIRSGHKVTLLERDHLGAHASGRAAGILAPRSELPHEDLAHRSGDLFPELVDRLEKDTGIALEYLSSESLTLAFDEKEAAALRKLDCRQLDGAACRKLEPALSPEVVAGALFEHAHITPLRLVEALARSAMMAGSAIREGTPVSSIEESGVRVVGERINADRVVLAAGPWSAGLAESAGVELDVWPLRGQLVALRPVRALLTRIVSWRKFYAVSKPDGTVIVGSTEEQSGFDARPTAEGVEKMLNIAQLMLPALNEATLERAWAALRPATKDGLPIIGPASGRPNLILATGHNRTGILLAPITAEMVAQAVSR